MPDEPCIALLFVTDKGKQECVRLYHDNLSDARRHAEQVLRVAGGLYIQVEIQAGGRAVETITGGELPAQEA